MIAYFSIAMREAEKTVHGGKARRLVEASALALRGTAQSFTIRYLKQRNSALLKQTHIDMATVKQRAEIIREKFNIDMSLSKRLFTTSSNTEKLNMSLPKGLSITPNVDN
jgi:hypothetical protein